MPKQTTQETFNAISASRNMNDLNKALDQIANHPEDERTQIIDALEKHTLTDFTTTDYEALDMAEGLMELGSALLGDDAIDAFSDDEDLFGFHATLKCADTVAQAKGDKTSPSLLSLLEKAAALSDDDYNSMMKLGHVFMQVAKETSAPAKKPQSENPFRGRYGGPKQ